MRVLIVGADRLGRVLADDLVRAGHDVRVLDDRPDALRLLPGARGARPIEGSALDRAVLADALAGCDALAAASEDDALNIVVALAARRELGVPLSVAVVANARRAEALAGMEIQVLCPTVKTARELHLTLVRSGVESELMLDDEAGVYRAELPVHLAGRRLEEITRPGELIPLAVERQGRVLIAVAGMEIRSGDVLHAVASRRELVRDLVELD